MKMKLLLLSFTFLLFCREEDYLLKERYTIDPGCKNMVCDREKEKKKRKETLLLFIYNQLLIEQNQICKNISLYYFTELFVGQNYSFSVANYRWYKLRNSPNRKIKFQIVVSDPDCKIRPYFEYLCYDSLFNSTVSVSSLYGGFLPTEQCTTSYCWAMLGQNSEITIQEAVLYYIFRFEGRDSSNNYKSCNFNVSLSEE